MRRKKGWTLQRDKLPKTEQRTHKSDSQIKTVGRWPWKLVSAKKRVTTYPSNLRLLKMDGAYLFNDALKNFILVGWHNCICEDFVWTMLEMHLEQILEVVASLLCVCGDGFILLIEGSYTILIKGKHLDIDVNLPLVVTRLRLCRKWQWCKFATVTGALECHVKKKH